MKVDLINGKVNKTFFTLLFSAIASTIITTIYSTIDMICVGHYCGPDGAAAIACTTRSTCARCVRRRVFWSIHSTARP